LQEGVNVQYLRPHKLFGRQALFTAGGNFHASQINVGLFPSVARQPNRLELNRALGIDNPDVLQTTARANVTNAFFRGTRPRVYVDSSPHLVANGGLTVSDYRGFFGYLGYRHTSWTSA
jgi:hypothetical protein